MERQVAEALRRLGAEKNMNPSALLRALEDAGCKVRGDVEEASMPGIRCPGGCGGERPLRQGEAVEASALGVSGWKVVRHVPRRCQKKNKDKRLWYNFVTQGEHERIWLWEDTHELQYFFTCNSWGVTAGWLRQFTQRAALQHVTFTREAEVHRAAAKRKGELIIIPDKAHLKLQKAWLCWRVDVRVHQHTNGNSNDERINLRPLLRRF
jgi:hypothetical protein